MSDRNAVALAVVVAVVAVAAPPVPPAAALLFVALWALQRRPAFLAVALLLLVGGRAHSSLDALSAPLPERIDGTATLASDPAPSRYGTRMVVRVEGRRYLAEMPAAVASGVRDMLTGEEVRIRGRPTPLRSAPPGWVRSQHLAGRLAVSEVTRLGSGAVWYRAANAVHRTLSSGAAPFGDRRPLYLGLVIGDDRGQSELTRFRFEAAGLTHLLAVSGSNVAFVLAVVAPLMRRLGRSGRLAPGAVVLVGFALVTRAEPSVLRAAVMAAVALTAVTAGRVAPAVRILAVTVVLLLVADPLLVHSLGFQLSVCATAGLVTLARPIAQRLPGPDALTVPLSVTLAAQLATAPLLLLLNGALPSASILANLAAVPAAGAVMTSGATVGVLAGLAGDTTAAIVQRPAVALVWWIDRVASVCSTLPLPLVRPSHLAVGAVGALSWWALGRRSVALPVRGVVVVVAVGASLGLAASAPSGAASTVVAAGARLHLGDCGGTVVELDRPNGERNVLTGLWRRGVRRIDLLVVGTSRSEMTTAMVVQEQFDVVRTVVPGDAAPAGMQALRGRELVVGGVRVRPAVDPDGREDGPAALIEADGARCSVAP